MRRALLAAVAAIIVLFGAAAGWWYLVAGRVDVAVRDAIAEIQRSGYAVAYERFAISGFPLRIRVRFDKPSVAYRSGASVAWQAAALDLDAPVWSLERIGYAAPGTNRIAVSPAGGADGIQIDVDGITGAFSSADKDGRYPWVANAATGTVAVSRRSDGAGLMTMPLSAFWLRLSGPSVWPLQAGGDAPRIDLANPGVFGSVIEQPRIAITLPTPPPDLTGDGLRRWRDAGGRLAIDAIAGKWGPLGVEAQGRLALDAGLRLAGEIDSRVTGFEPAVDRLTQLKLIPADNAPALKLLGRFMSLGGTGNGLQLTFRLEDGWIVVGPVKLARLLPLPEALGLPP